MVGIVFSSLRQGCNYACVSALAEEDQQLSVNRIAGTKSSVAGTKSYAIWANSRVIWTKSRVIWIN
jgi:hypothetical protein